MENGKRRQYDTGESPQIKSLDADGNDIMRRDLLPDWI